MLDNVLDFIERNNGEGVLLFQVQSGWATNGESRGPDDLDRDMPREDDVPENGYSEVLYDFAYQTVSHIYEYEGDYVKALDYHTRSLEIAEELGDKSGMGSSLNNIGLVHSNKGDLDKALDYYERSLAIKEELGDKRDGISLTNIGLVHHDKGNYDKALDYYERSHAIREEIGDKTGIGIALNNIGFVNSDKGNYEKALESSTQNDFCYLDPPYQPEQEGGFTSYTKDSFNEENQLRLSKLITKLGTQHTNVMLSNSATQYIRKLYQKSTYKISEFPTLRSINSDAKNRKGSTELIIMNYS